MVFFSWRITFQLISLVPFKPLEVNCLNKRKNMFHFLLYFMFVFVLFFFNICVSAILPKPRKKKNFWINMDKKRTTYSKIQYKTKTKCRKKICIAHLYLVCLFIGKCEWHTGLRLLSDGYNPTESYNALTQFWWSKWGPAVVSIIWTILGCLKAATLRLFWIL